MTEADFVSTRLFNLGAGGEILIRGALAVDGVFAALLPCEGSFAKHAVIFSFGSQDLSSTLSLILMQIFFNDFLHLS